ncbi:MAG TPA: hypothetical protein PKN33_15910 [Phycisphaerae bacterium]|nr:hypothetical protein [Phycisphaerae bacterium]
MRYTHLSRPITNEQIRRLKGNRELLVGLLEDLGRRIYGVFSPAAWPAVRCPFHYDQRPSGYIHRPNYESGEFAYSCFACEWNRCAKNGASGTGDVIHVARMALAKNDKPAGFVDAVQFLRRYRERIATLESVIPLLHTQRHPNPEPDPAMLLKARDYMPKTQRALQDSAALTRLLWESRAVDADTAKRFGVGHSADEKNGAYWSFPIVDGNGTLQVVKLHAVDSAVPKSFWFPPHAKQGQPLYPVDAQTGGPIWLCSGELKALAVISTGLPAIGLTSGESVVRVTEGLLRLFRHRTVALVADNDATGIKWVTAMMSVLLEKGIPSRCVDLSLQQPGDDIGDWLVHRRVVEQVTVAAVRAELLRRFSEARQ